MMVMSKLLPEIMGKNRNARLLWRSALIGAAAAAILAAAKPRAPAIELMSINLTSLKLNLPFLDAELILTVHVTNPNIAAVRYSSATVSIYYDGCLLGSAAVSAGNQSARSCQVLRLPARLDGMELASHAAKFFADVARREMVLDAKVDVEGAAMVLWWDHTFALHVESHVVVDPVFLDVIDQENRSQIEVFIG